MKRIFIFLFFASITSSVFAQTARVQVVHNSADALAAEVDVYVDAALAIDNFAFRTATSFLDIAAGVPVNLSIAPANSTSVNDAVLTVPVTLTVDETYLVVADGIVSPMGYNPAPPLGLQVYAMGREMATDPNNTDVLVHHGSTDAPTVDVVETGVGAGTIVDDLAYTDFQGYLELTTADYVIEIRDNTGTVGVAAYQAPLATLNLDGAALMVVASGFLDPSQNSNGAAFGLFVALPAGGPLVELPSAPLGVTDFDKSSVRLYPNPATNEINLETSGVDVNDLNVKIIDIQGRIMARDKVDTVNKSINISNLSTGMYHLMLLSGNDLLDVKRFIKR